MNPFTMPRTSQMPPQSASSAHLKRSPQATSTLMEAVNRAKADLAVSQRDLERLVLQAATLT